MALPQKPSGRRSVYGEGIIPAPPSRSHTLHLADSGCRPVPHHQSGYLESTPKPIRQRCSTQDRHRFGNHGCGLDVPGNLPPGKSRCPGRHSLWILGRSSCAALDLAIPDHGPLATGTLLAVPLSAREDLSVGEIITDRTYAPGVASRQCGLRHRLHPVSASWRSVGTDAMVVFVRGRPTDLAWPGFTQTCFRNNTLFPRLGGNPRRDLRWDGPASRENWS